MRLRLHNPIPLIGRPRLLVFLSVLVAALSFFSAGALAWFSYDLTSGLPDNQAIRDIGDMAQSTTIYDVADEPVFTIFKEQRIEVPLDRISPNLIKAVLSVEDQRFYEHSGIDAIRVGGAVLRNIEAGRRAEGGSTITQQLARQSFLTPDKTYRRKLKEVIVAAYIERIYTKEEILQLYLNKVYFGDGLYGVEAASRGYFGKSASDVTVAEAALLAGLIKSPSSYAPTVNRERAIARRNLVLQTMVASGAIDAAEAAAARKTAVEIRNGLEIREDSGLYFKEQVRRELVDRFGWERVYQGGLRVYTTLNRELQAAAEKILEKSLQDIERRRGFSHPARGKHAPPAENEPPDYLQGALTSIDLATGYVHAMVGGRDFGESRFNRAVQAKRQSGSAFKPFVYAAALEAGHSPATVITGLNDPILVAEGEWVPEDEHTTASSMTLRSALRTSSNRAAVQLLNTVGISNAVGYAEKLNVGTPPSVPSLALGSGDVSLIALTAAYGAFGNGGVLQQPVLIRRVEDGAGKVLHQHEPKPQRAISESTAFLMSSMLADVINAGTAYRARQAGFTLPAAGKTGTTNDYVDAWFIGYTPRVVTGVWIGFDRPKTIISNGYAGELAVPMWASFMKTATRGHKPQWLDRPAGISAINVCRISGKLPNSGCDSVPVVSREGFVENRSMIYTEYFARGTRPDGVCPVHETPSLLDRLAGIFGKDSETPVPVDEAGLPPASAAQSGTSGTRPAPPAPAPFPSAAPPPQTASPAPPQVEDPPEEPKKKRGFWSRVFGRNRDDKRDDRQENDEKKPDQKRPTGTKPGGRP